MGLFIGRSRMRRACTAPRPASLPDVFTVSERATKRISAKQAAVCDEPVCLPSALLTQTSPPPAAAAAVRQSGVLCSRGLRRRVSSAALLPLCVQQQKHGTAVPPVPPGDGDTANGRLSPPELAINGCNGFLFGEGGGAREGADGGVRGGAAEGGACRRHMSEAARLLMHSDCHKTLIFANKLRSVPSRSAAAAAARAAAAAGAAAVPTDSCDTGRARPIKGAVNGFVCGGSVSEEEEEEESDNQPLARLARLKLELNAASAASGAASDGGSAATDGGSAATDGGIAASDEGRHNHTSDAPQCASHERRVSSHLSSATSSAGGDGGGGGDVTDVECAAAAAAAAVCPLVSDSGDCDRTAAVGAAASAGAAGGGDVAKSCQPLSVLVSRLSQGPGPAPAPARCTPKSGRHCSLRRLAGSARDPCSAAAAVRRKRLSSTSTSTAAAAATAAADSERGVGERGGQLKRRRQCTRSQTVAALADTAAELSLQRTCDSDAGSRRLSAAAVAAGGRRRSAGRSNGLDDQSDSVDSVSVVDSAVKTGARWGRGLRSRFYGGRRRSRVAGRGGVRRSSDCPPPQPCSVRGAGRGRRLRRAGAVGGRRGVSRGRAQSRVGSTAEAVSCHASPATTPRAAAVAAAAVWSRSRCAQPSAVRLVPKRPVGRPPGRRSLAARSCPYVRAPDESLTAAASGGAGVCAAASGGAAAAPTASDCPPVDAASVAALFMFESAPAGEPWFCTYSRADGDCSVVPALDQRPDALQAIAGLFRLPYQLPDQLLYSDTPAHQLVRHCQQPEETEGAATATVSHSPSVSSSSPAATAPAAPSSLSCSESPPPQAGVPLCDLRARHRRVAQLISGATCAAAGSTLCSADRLARKSPRCHASTRAAARRSCLLADMAAATAASAPAATPAVCQCLTVDSSEQQLQLAVQQLSQLLAEAAAQPADQIEQQMALLSPADGVSDSGGSGSSCSAGVQQRKLRRRGSNTSTGPATSSCSSQHAPEHNDDLSSGPDDAPCLDELAPPVPADDWLSLLLTAESSGGELPPAPSPCQLFSLADTQDACGAAVAGCASSFPSHVLAPPLSPCASTNSSESAGSSCPLAAAAGRRAARRRTNRTGWPRKPPSLPQRRALPTSQQQHTSRQRPV